MHSPLYFAARVSLSFWLLAGTVSCALDPASAELPGKTVTRTNLTGSFTERRAYNDPCVIKVGDEYRMYLSRNAEDIYADGRQEPVSVFYATSADGVEWSVAEAEVIGLGAAGEWDYTKVETPSVVFFDGRYHLYYSGGSVLDKPAAYKIGHAVSDDLAVWTKNRANPILSPSSIVDASQVLHVAEPGAVVVGDRLYLYFTVTRQRPTGTPSALMEIYVSVSDDGYAFGKPIRVLSQGCLYPASSSYAGYSTPSALAVNGTVELYYDVYRQTNGNISAVEQVRLHRARSYDGLSFVEDALPLLGREDQPWTAREIRGGSELAEDGLRKMWFSGDNYAYGALGGSGGMSVGYMTWKEE